MPLTFGASRRRVAAITSTAARVRAWSTEATVASGPRYPAPTGSRLTHDQSLAFGAALMTFSESVRGALDLGIRLSQLRVRAVVQPGNAPSTWLLDLAIELGGSGTHVQLDDLATAAARSPRTIEVLSKRWTVSIRSPSVQVVPTGLPRVM